MTNFSHKIDKDSPSNSSGSPPVSDDCMAGGQSRRILEAVDFRVTLADHLTGAVGKDWGCR